jgi:histidinol-phosphate aminotransferase
MIDPAMTEPPRPPRPDPDPDRSAFQPLAPATGPAVTPNAVALASGYHSAQVEVSVRLNTNEAPEAPPQEFLDELAGAVRRLSANRYPDRRALDLRAGIAAHHGVELEQIFCANGSNEVLQCLFLAYGGTTRCTVIFEPTYALHSHIARLTGTEVVTGQRDSEFLVDVESALDLIRTIGIQRSAGEPSITMLCSPNNPTGSAEPPATVAALAAAAPGLLVVDEAYGQFAPWSALRLVESNPRVVVVRTFSKTWAMAGLRLGYLVAHADVVGACEHVALPYHLDAIKQTAGVLALGFEPEMRLRVARLVEQRGRVAAGLGLLGAEVWPSDANFILFRLPGLTSAEVWQRLVHRSILVRDVSAWPGLEGCLRVTIGTPVENDRFLSGLDDVLSEAELPAQPSR